MNLKAFVIFLISSGISAVPTQFSNKTVAIHKRDSPGFNLLVNGISSAIAIALIPKTGKVVMVERRAGIVGTTHSQVVDIQSASVRQLKLPNDNWCSAGYISPDPSARLYNIGAFSGNLKSIIQYIPCGTPGSSADDRCDWWDVYPAASLLQNRWYPTSIPMPNGKVAVISGTSFSVGLPDGSIPVSQTTLEWIPDSNGLTTVPFLVNNLQWNLYPIAFVLTDGSVFLMAGNKAEVVEPVNFQTKKSLPSNFVNGKAAFRTYPFAAGSTILPLRPANNYNPEVIICGGNTQGGKTQIALNDCSRMFPLDPNPTWVQETMPEPRQMNDMVLLPDGTILFVNGASDGQQGWNTYTNPSLTAWIYNPDLPNNRFTIGGTTNIPRLYHSEALLLEDGRVLISGSTPNSAQTNLNKIWEDETRIETYSPPYLFNGYQRPVINSISSDNWEYASEISMDAVISAGTPSDIKAVIMINGFVTHTLHMGQRLVELVITISNETGIINVKTPPNANIAPPGWYMLFLLDANTPSIAKWVLIGSDIGKTSQWPGPISPSKQCISDLPNRAVCGDGTFSQASCEINACCWDNIKNSCYSSYQDTPVCVSNLDNYLRETCNSVIGLNGASICPSNCCTGAPQKNGPDNSVLPASTPYCYMPSYINLNNTYQVSIDKCVANLAGSLRTICGPAGTTSTTCPSTCCWSKLSKSATGATSPNCYKPTSGLTETAKCIANLDLAYREACGGGTLLTLAACEAAGCCFDGSTTSKKCYYPSTWDPPICVANLAGSLRTICGPAGTTSTTCPSTCCWSKLSKSATGATSPNCYKPTSGLTETAKCIANLDLAYREACGGGTLLTLAACEAAGCCFDGSTTSKKCYYPSK